MSCLNPEDLIGLQRPSPHRIFGQEIRPERSRRPVCPIPLVEDVAAVVLLAAAVAPRPASWKTSGKHARGGASLWR